MSCELLANKIIAIAAFLVMKWMSDMSAQSFTTLLKAARGISVIAPLTLGMIHTGVEQKGMGLCVVMVVSVSGKEEGNDDWCLPLV